MGLELYLDLLSQPSRAVYIFAKKNGIPFQTRTVDILKGQHMSEQFSQVNCLNKVPVLKDGSFVLTERCSCKYTQSPHYLLRLPLAAPLPLEWGAGRGPGRLRP